MSKDPAKRPDRSEYLRDYRERNRESIRAKGRAYRAANREKMRAAYQANQGQHLENKKAYYEANKERLKAKQRAYNKANPGTSEQARQRQHQWYIENRERRAVEAKVYREANREAIAERNRAYYEANKERYAARGAAWGRANPDKVAVRYNRRRARMQAVVTDLTNDQWQTILAEFDGHCAYCDRTDRPLTQEHMVPISRGGPHTAANVIPACLPCNSRKHTRTALEFAGWESPPQRSATTEKGITNG